MLEVGGALVVVTVEPLILVSPRDTVVFKYPRRREGVSSMPAEVLPRQEVDNATRLADEFSSPGQLDGTVWTLE